MNEKMWSTYVQRPDTLYRTRGIKFRQEYKEALLKATGIEDGMNVLEIGCGPGLLCHRLAGWMPNSSVTGVDRDENFISYAKLKNDELKLNCSFVKGDALSLPFADNTFNACTSHTVIEHIPAVPFLKEQYRVCRPGGVVSVMSSRTEASINPEDWQPSNAEEQELWARVDEASSRCTRENKVCAYPCSVHDIPEFMEEAGFVDVSVDFIAFTFAPDSAQYNMSLREEFIEANRQVALDAVVLAQNYAPGVWSNEEVIYLKEMINQRFNKRISALHKGIKLWDISASMLMVTRGYKPKYDLF